MTACDSPARLPPGMTDEDERVRARWAKPATYPTTAYQQQVAPFRFAKSLRAALAPEL